MVSRHQSRFLKDPHILACVCAQVCGHTPIIYSTFLELFKLKCWLVHSYGCYFLICCHHMSHCSFPSKITELNSFVQKWTPEAGRQAETKEMSHSLYQRRGEPGPCEQILPPEIDRPFVPLLCAKRHLLCAEHSSSANSLVMLHH